MASTLVTEKTREDQRWASSERYQLMKLNTPMDSVQIEVLIQELWNVTYWFSNNRSVVKGINKFKIPADSNNSEHNIKEQSWIFRRVFLPQHHMYTSFGTIQIVFLSCQKRQIFLAWRCQILNITKFR